MSDDLERRFEMATRDVTPPPPDLAGIHQRGQRRRRVHALTAAGLTSIVLVGALAGGAMLRDDRGDMPTVLNPAPEGRDGERSKSARAQRVGTYGEASRVFDGKRAHVGMTVTPDEVERDQPPRLALENLGELPLGYGTSYVLERETDDGWEWVNRDQVSDLVGSVLRPGEKSQPQEVAIPARLLPGLYRVTKTVTVEGASDEGELEISATFEVIERRDRNAPPPVTVSSSDRSFDLTAWSYCFGNMCASGGPPASPPDIGSPDEVFVEFPLEGWSFDAFFTPVGERCGRVQQVSVEDTEEGRLVLRPAGYADTYDVTLFGRGEGDLSVTFRWTTPEDGPLPEPKARAAILGGSPRNPDSYGIELALENLAETPDDASATITVSAEKGESVTFEAQLARSRCRPEGSLYWDGPDDMGRRATELGEGPFRYEVEVVLDGRRYLAEATWPDDEIRGNEPSVRLDFSPALPALR